MDGDIRVEVVSRLMQIVEYVIAMFYKYIPVMSQEHP